MLAGDPQVLFDEACDRAEVKSCDFIRQFPQRSDRERVVELMGYEEREAENGTLFFRTW